MNLKDRSCAPSTSQTPAITGDEVESYLNQLTHPWSMTSEGHLEGVFKFKNFVQAMNFANKLTEIAEVENHHPDLHIRWGQCRVEIWTHTIKGVSESDFIFAAKSESVYTKL